MMIQWIRNNPLFTTIALTLVIFLVGLRFGVVVVILIPAAWLLTKIVK